MLGSTLVGSGRTKPGPTTLPACAGARDVAVVTVGAAARADRLHQRRRFVDIRNIRLMSKRITGNQGPIFRIFRTE